MNPILPLFIAQTTTNAHIGEAMAIGAFLVGLAAVIVGLILQLRRKPPIEAEFATKLELKELNGRMSSIETKMDARHSDLREMIADMYEKIERSDESRTSSLHNRMNAMVEVMREFKGEMKGSMENLPCNRNGNKGCPS